MNRYIKTACFIALVGCPSVLPAQISTPYFGKLASKDVCGNFNSYCQPTSSLEYDRIKGADFNGLDEWLGTSYNKSPFNRASCSSPFSAEADVRVSGETNFSVTFSDNYKGQLRALAEVDLASYLGALLAALPLGLQAKLKADATDKLVTSKTGSADFVYRRYDLTMLARTKLLPTCYTKTNGKRKVVTGVSVITMSGSWARSRLIESFGVFESSADFIGLSSDNKADYIDKRNKAMKGDFEPLAFVIATSWRKKD